MPNLQQLASAMRWLAAAALAIGFAMPGRAAPPPPQNVVIAYQPLVAVPEGAMKQQKWFDEAVGVPVEWKNFSSGADVNTAFAAGAVDFGLVGLPVFVSGLAQGIPYRLITIFDIPGTADALAARQGSGIKTVADLKGKRIGVPFGSGADYMLQGVLKENGLSADDVTLVNLQPQPIVAAWSTGQIDAAQIWAPILTKLMSNGGTLLTDDGEMAKKGYFAGDVAVVSNRFAEQHPDLVQRWVEQNLRAVDWVNANGPGAYAAMMKEYELTAAELKDGALPPATRFPDRQEQLDNHWMGGGNQAGLIASSERIGKFLQASGLIEKAPTREQLAAGIDARFLRQANVPPAPK